MPLQSTLLKGDPKLEACLVSDPAHIMQGASGPAVHKIQAALIATDGATIGSRELSASLYGPSTAAAVLAFKKNPRRNILNYKGQFDDIVGKKTTAALDAEMVAIEGATPTVSPDMQLVNAADGRRLAALMKTEEELKALKAAFEPGVPDPNNPTVQALQRQLFIPMNSNFGPVVNTFLSLVQTNRLTSAPFMVDRADPNFAHVDSSNQPAGGRNPRILSFQCGTAALLLDNEQRGGNEVPASLGTGRL